eukprot:5668793-Pyramimonas_sp.AAC.1
MWASIALLRGSRHSLSHSLQSSVSCFIRDGGIRASHGSANGEDDYLALPTDKLLQQCTVDYMRTSGPGVWRGRTARWVGLLGLLAGGNVSSTGIDTIHQAIRHIQAQG